MTTVFVMCPANSLPECEIIGSLLFSHDCVISYDCVQCVKECEKPFNVVISFNESVEITNDTHYEPIYGSSRG